VLAASGAPQALAAAIEPLLSSAQLRREIGRAGAERFMRDFTDKAMRDRLFKQLESIARRKGLQV
jgi:glycosyltransferase involved in cell wall biosynthesis